MRPVADNRTYPAPGQEPPVGRCGPQEDTKGERRNLDAMLRDNTDKAVRLRSIVNDISDHIHGPRPMPGHSTGDKQTSQPSLLDNADALESILIDALMVAEGAARSLGVSTV